MSRARYMLTRCLQTIFLLWLVLSFLWVFFRLMPGDFTNIMLSNGAPPETVEQFKEEWGLNDPLYVQYFRYIMNFIQLDAGMSIQYRRPVVDYVGIRIFNTFILAAPAITLAYIAGSVFGTVLGTRRGSKLEKYGIIPLIFAGSFPSFFIAIMLIVIFAGILGIFPTSGLVSASLQSEYADAPWWRIYLTKDFLWHWILPFTAVFTRYLFLPSLIMRTSIVEVLSQNFTYYHRITGLPRLQQLRHIAKHASLPVITLYPISMTRAIGGLVLIETVFNWPGIGFTLISSVLARDYPVAQFVFFLVAAFIIIANFGVDIVYGLIDPRISIDDEA